MSADVQKEQQGAFPSALRGELGYRTDQVDAFLARARSTYDLGFRAKHPVTAEELRQASFALQRRGYSVRLVDAAMDRLEEVFYERERRVRVAQIGEDAWWAEVGQLLREVRGRIERQAGSRFRRCGVFATGYQRAQVDAFLDQIAQVFTGQAQVTLEQVRSVVFHSQLRGYREDQVDAFLDSVIELVLATRQS